ncbi:hypothetical protein VNI00_013484 [Paramarasmius palmivorus]|uniref:Uncharacterized protein n=1 Tax=Paramarasmius palmivorus TaxID=297713 RepID=A0AAW0BYB3_9AGAR
MQNCEVQIQHVNHDFGTMVSASTTGVETVPASTSGLGPSFVIGSGSANIGGIIISTPVFREFEANVRPGYTNFLSAIDAKDKRLKEVKAALVNKEVENTSLNKTPATVKLSELNLNVDRAVMLEKLNNSWVVFSKEIIELCEKHGLPGGQLVIGDGGKQTNRLKRGRFEDDEDEDEEDVEEVDERPAKANPGPFSQRKSVLPGTSITNFAETMLTIGREALPLWTRSSAPCILNELESAPYALLPFSS